MIGIYHSRDLDGYASGAIIKHKYPNAKLIGFDYGQELDFGSMKEDEPIIMSDVSVPIEDMEKLLLHSCFSFTWIDHHKSQILEFVKHCEIKDYKEKELLKGMFKGINVHLHDGISACEGTWKYLFPDKPIPRGIFLLGEYDTWRNQDKNRWDNEILPFQYGMRMICNSAETFPTYLFENDYQFIEDVIEKGKTILKYQAQINETACKAAFEHEFEGLRLICLNSSIFNSDVFKSVYDESKHDAMMPFKYDGVSKQWILSMYGTKDIDLSVIAKKWGGGGHKSACGFQVKDITTIFKNINVNQK